MASCRLERLKVVSIISSSADVKNPEATSTATAKEKPNTVKAERTDQRIRLRRIIITGCERPREVSIRSRSRRLKRGGAGGAMATAGGRRAARIALRAAPRPALAMASRPDRA